jgi:hypothetical protein
LKYRGMPKKCVLHGFTFFATRGSVWLPQTGTGQPIAQVRTSLCDPRPRQLGITFSPGR